MIPRRKLQLIVVLILTAVTAVAAAIIAQGEMPFLNDALKIGQRRVAPPLAAIPFLLAGYWVVFRIIRADQRERYELSLKNPPPR